MSGLGEFLLGASPVVMILIKVTALLSFGFLMNFSLLRVNPRWRVLMWRGVLVGLVVLACGELSTPKYLIGIEVADGGEGFSNSIGEVGEVEFVPAVSDEGYWDFESGISSVPFVDADVSTAPILVEENQADDSGVVYPASNPVGEWAKEHVVLLMVVCWLVVALFLLLRVAAVAIRIRRTVGAASAASDEVVAVAESVARDLECDAKVDVRVMQDLGSPFLVGVRRPIIVLP